MPDQRSQRIALLLIAVAMCAIPLGEFLHFRDLTVFATSVGGGGVEFSDSNEARCLNDPDARVELQVVLS